MHALLLRAAQLARTRQPLLIAGESGCGHAALAHAIHRATRDDNGPILTLRTDEDFEKATSGTLYIAEWSALPPQLQGALIAYLDQPQRGARLIVATRQEEAALMRSDGMASAIAARLSASTLRLLPLRERLFDVVPMAEALVRRLSVRRGSAARQLALSCKRALLCHAWPGNVPELRRAIAHAYLRSLREPVGRRPYRIQRCHLPAQLLRKASVLCAKHVVLPLGLSLKEVERTFIAATLVACGGNRSAAAEALLISRRSLYDRLRAGPKRYFEKGPDAIVHNLQQSAESASDLQQSILEQSSLEQSVLEQSFLEQSSWLQTPLRKAG